MGLSLKTIPEASADQVSQCNPLLRETMPMVRDPEETVNTLSFSSAAFVQAMLDSWFWFSWGRAEAPAGSLHAAVSLLRTQEQNRYKRSHFNDQVRNRS